MEGEGPTLKTDANLCGKIQDRKVTDQAKKHKNNTENEDRLNGQEKKRKQKKNTCISSLIFFIIILF